MSIEIETAEAVKEALNGHTFSIPFIATRDYQPAKALSELVDLTVTIIPKATTEEIETRASSSGTVTIDIAVQRKTDTSVDDLDELMGVVGEIKDFLRMLDVGTVRFTGIEHDPLWIPNHLAENRLFTSVIAVTYRNRNSRA